MFKSNPFLSPEDVRELSSGEERAHSKFSASGSERWLKCAASVALEEASPPSKDNAWSIEGTVAHSVYEAMLNGSEIPDHYLVTEEMLLRVSQAVLKVRGLHKLYGGKLLVEKRVYAQFIHEEMFGTTDTIIAPDKPYLGKRTLHILDYKDGAGHIVGAEKNTQLIQYALSVAESYDWESSYDEAKLWILQPRAGKNWFPSWVVPIKELRETWLPLWRQGVRRVEAGKSKPFPGAHCHWCRAKSTCPAKNETRVNRVVDLFSQPIDQTKELSHVGEKQGRASAQQGKARKAEAKEQVGKKGAHKESKGWPRKIEDYEGEESFY